MTNLSNMTPAEIDQRWLDEVMRPRSELLRKRLALVQRADECERREDRWFALRAPELREDAAKLDVPLAGLRALESPFLEEWDRRDGWTRAYVVPDGHIHRGTSCFTLHPTTVVLWIPEMSGKTEDEIVEYAGVHACTVCYPSAPVEALRAAELEAKRQGECPGSRTFEYKNWHRTSYTGTGHAVCNHCGQRVGTSKNQGKMRAHKREGSR